MLNYVQGLKACTTALLGLHFLQTDVFVLCFLELVRHPFGEIFYLGLLPIF